jgi:hypothetical protein
LFARWISRRRVLRLRQLLASESRLGEQSVKFKLDAHHNAIRHNTGNDTWLLQATVTFQFPGLRAVAK